MQLAQTCTEKTIISIHALLAESDIGSYSLFAATGISIHALLAESDCAAPRARLHNGISIHALLAESDNMLAKVKGTFLIFLSTLSLRRATGVAWPFQRLYVDFYPRSPCGERPVQIAILDTNNSISIHALLAESDQAIPAAKPALRYFYPRSPCGERQILFFRHSASIFISIHALLAESDLRFLHVWLAFKTFLSTLSLRRATPGTPHAMSQHL